MEENTTQPLNPSENPQVPQPVLKTPHSPSSKKLFIILGIIGVLLLITTGIGSYYLGAKSSTNNKSSNTNPSTTSPTQNPIPTETTMPSTNPSDTTDQLPTDWTYELSTTCNVNLPLPPKKAPYYIPDDPNTNSAIDEDGKYWQIENTTDTQSNAMFPNWSRIIYSNPNEGGSGYVAGLVDVKCDTNTKNYTTASLLEQYEQNFTDGTFSGISLNSKEIVTLWGRQVAKITIKGGMYDSNNPEYLLATNKHIYHISSVSMSESKNVQETTDLILTNLQFKD